MNPEAVLILATSLNDGHLAAEILTAAGLTAEACADSNELSRGLGEGCGAVVIAEECLTEATVTQIESALNAQPTWSDMPVILLTTHENAPLRGRFPEVGNASLLERPFSKQTFIRAVKVALRARRKQYQLRALLAELTTAKEEAERANVTKSQFLANMSHEIRTPIGAIIGFSDLIKQPNLASAERGRYTEIINRNSHQLLRLIDDILDLSKVEAGKIAIEDIDFKFPDLVADLTSIMKFRAVEKGIEFRVGLDSVIPEFICSDPVRLRQILSNVVGNAIKFTTSGFVEMRIDYKDPYLDFDIRDTGLGLSSEQSENLFKPFVQADASTTRRFGGTGLGLSISKQLAKAMGGDVELRSTTPGRGTEFAVKIKIKPMDGTKLVGPDSLIIKPTTPKTEPDAPILNGLHVLLVEDSADNQMLITRYLKKAGCHVTVANDGEEGVKKATEGSYDVVLMDIQMPKLDGHEATRRLRASGYLSPIVALTAHAMAEEKRKSFESGFTDFLTKPIQPSTLIGLLARFNVKPEA